VINFCLVRPILQFKDCVDKPPCSFVCMIALAIAQSPSHQLAVGDIYSWIKGNFVHFRENENSGWKVRSVFVILILRPFVSVEDGI
jgi:hypothetical protein